MMNPRVNEELIDNLVCGTLTGAEYRKAILALEADPQKWRDCALAFLSEQALTQELTQLSRSEIDWQQKTSSPSELCNAPKSPIAHGSPVENSVAKSELAATAVSPKPSDPLGWLYKLGTLAALLLLSFSVGWIGSSVRDSSARNGTELDNLADTSEVSDRVKLAQDPPRNLKVDQMSVDQVLPTNKFGSNNYSFVGNSNTSLLPIDEEMPENLVRLEREGRIRIEKTTAILPVECDSGTMLVPVQQIRIVPTTFSY